ncbi:MULTISPECIES: NETI motif-containing protein [unclassified Bacillus (in: firmicutes)]|uniref:NETI motif-containing protein n=1 Tax=unclassified Bacillus (in: firmicutes) TaxID=185979 RepID=UPI0008E058A1|nr:MULTISPECIES: NETI motif-containing protein [unclassified Bacillus (in: firmicutes)]SFB23699.1 NETI protein [Bacillus sp. UNCCL13]SFQ87910.1 NETI protein [Bacillus sp. cl95]
MAKAKKMKFEVQENETISECLDRIKAEGYVPTSRMEKPLFEEVKEDGETVYKPIGRKIVFEAKLLS